MRVGKAWRVLVPGAKRRDVVALSGQGTPPNLRETAPRFASVVPGARPSGVEGRRAAAVPCSIDIDGRTSNRGRGFPNVKNPTLTNQRVGHPREPVVTT
jgi:hypothetical protein